MELTMIKPTRQESATKADDERWQAVRARRADATFYYAVITTGIFCRPSCPSRQARRENVSFHASTTAAEAAGYRPCKRCRPCDPAPDAAQRDMIARICRHIEDAETPPDLDALAALAGLSRFYFHRLFKATVGVTPRAYGVAARKARMRAALDGQGTVTDALYRAGFNSHARFYAATNATLGMTPREYRAGGAGQTIRFAVGDCALGAILVAATARGLCSITLGDDPQALLSELEDRFDRAELIGGDASFEATVARVIALVERPGEGHDLPLDLQGTAFQERVWEALTRIPPATTASYAEIARAIGAPKAARAVAKACAANTLAVAIPCHRVVRSDGSLSGYRWGIERKRALLESERNA